MSIHEYTYITCTYIYHIYIYNDYFEKKITLVSHIKHYDKGNLF